MKAIIIGGGIAGLASALALTRHNWQVEVLERAPEFTEADAGLSLWPNALRALDALGVGELVRGRATLSGQAGIRDAAGRWLSPTDTAELERRYGPVAMIHRADLLAVLRAAVPDEALRPGTTVTAVQPDGTAAHSAGVSRADLIVGAEGVHSITRRSVWPDAPVPRYAGLAAYDRQRRPRTQMIARRSRRIGAAAQWVSPPAVHMRNTALRLLPPHHSPGPWPRSWTGPHDRHASPPLSGTTDKRNHANGGNVTGHAHHGGRLSAVLLPGESRGTS